MDVKKKNNQKKRPSELSGQDSNPSKKQNTQFQTIEVGPLESKRQSQHGSSSCTPLKKPKIEERIREKRPNINNEELIVAARRNKVEKVKQLITEGVDINFVDKCGNTALHYAVINGNEELVNYLLEKRADINIEDDNNNKTPFDIAVNYKNENIIKILGKEIVDKSLEIIKKPYYSPNALQNKERTITSNEESDLKDKGKTEKKLEALANYLEAFKPNDDALSYKQANVFILFLETFAFQNIPEKAAIADTRALLLKNKGVIKLRDVKKIIETCYNKEAYQDTSKVNSFFNKLKKYIKRKTDKSNNSLDDVQIGSFFEKFPPTPERVTIGKSDTTTNTYIELRNLVLKAYKKEENLDQCWFEFVVNIYPALNLQDEKIKDEKISDIEKQLRHLRTNLIHEFYRFGIQEFREAIINLRGKLFEYYYAKKVYRELKLLTPGKDIKEIKRDFNKVLQDLQDEFKDSGEFLSEAEARSLFGYKFVKSLFTKQSVNRDSDVKVLVEDYFKYMSIVEDVNRVSQDDGREGNEDSECNKKLEDVARRELFEKFISLKRIKENFTDETYREEQKELSSDLRQYGVEEATYYLVCEYYLEKGNNFNEENSKIIENVVKFIKDLILLKETHSDYKGKDIVSLGELFLNIVDKELILTENSSNKNKFNKKAETSANIRHISNQVKSFCNAYIKIGGIILKIGVRQIVKNMLRTFYNAYNEYKIEFNVEDIFSRESFLNELVWQGIKDVELRDSNKFVIIYKLIDIDYMSPYIVKLIESRITKGEDIQIKDNNNLKDLTDFCQQVIDNNVIKLIDGSQEAIYKANLGKLIEVINKIIDKAELVKSIDTRQVIYEANLVKCINASQNLIDKAKKVKSIVDNKRAIDEDNLKKLVDASHQVIEKAKLVKFIDPKEVIDKAHLVKLIDNMGSKEEYINYLNILLGINVKSCNLYAELYNKILEKKVDIKKIRSVFKEFKHLTEFADLLKPTGPTNEQQENILELTKSFVRIINEEAADRLYYIRDYNKDKTLKILGKGQEIQNRFEKGIENSDLDFIDRDLLIVRIYNRHRKYNEALKILKKAEHKLKSVASIDYKIKLLLTFSDIVYTKGLLKNSPNNNPNYDDLYSKIINYALDLDDVSEKFDIAQTVKEKYNQIKNRDEYMNLLSSSTLLNSKKHLDILRIAGTAAYQLRQYRNDKTKLNNALKIYEEIYSCYKKDLGKNHRNTIQIVKGIADSNSVLGKNSKINSVSLSYYQCTLMRFNIVYNALEKFFGPDHDAVINIRKRIAKAMCDTACAHNKLGVSKLSRNSEEALEHCHEALKMYEEAYEFQKKHLGEKHEHSIKSLLGRADTNRNIARIKSSQNNQVKALEYYDKAIEMYKQVLIIQKETLHKKNNRIKQTEKQLKITEDEKEKLEKKTFKSIIFHQV